MGILLSLHSLHKGLLKKIYILKSDPFAHAMQHSNSQVSTSCSLIPGKSMGLV